MEEKLLKAKELSELLVNLKKINTHVRVIPQDNGNVTLEVVQQLKFQPETSCRLLHTESFHSYADDPAKCTLILLRNFFSEPNTAEHISSPHN